MTMERMQGNPCFSGLLAHFASFRNVGDAIARETEIEGQEKKVALIERGKPDLG